MRNGELDAPGRLGSRVSQIDDVEVVFEDIVLVFGCVESAKEMRIVALRRARDVATEHGLAAAPATDAATWDSITR